MPHDSPLLGGHTPGSDEGRMQQHELMELVKKLEKIFKSNKARRRAKFIVSDNEEDLEDSSKQGRKIADIDQDSDISLVHHDADIQRRYEDISTVELNISTAKPVTTAGVSTTEPDISTTNVPVSTAGAEANTAVERQVYIKRSAAQRKDKGKAIMT
ncbi:hypothetical protein Tco_0200300 [Tanacetum coccineum]